MGKKGAAARAVNSFLPPLFACVLVYFVVLCALTGLGTVDSLTTAAAFAAVSSLAVGCLILQATRGAGADHDARVRELFRRTSTTYSRLKSAIRQGGNGQRKLNHGSEKTYFADSPAGVVSSSSFSASSSSSSATTIPMSAVSGTLPAKIIEAVRQGDGTTIERWIRANNVDAQDDGSGSSLLHFAALEDQSRIGRALLKAGANPVLQDSLGNQPLHIAAAKGSAVLVKYLVEHGAQPYAQNAERVSPMDLAEEFDNRGCVLIMERAVRASASTSSLPGLGPGGSALRGRTPQRDLGV